MSFRNRIALDDDVWEGVLARGRAMGRSLSETLNDLVRNGLAAQQNIPDRKSFRVKAQPMGLRPGLSYDDVESLIEYGEGELHS